MKTELIKWFTPGEKMPDDGATILLDLEDGEYSLGYHDEGQWFDDVDLPIRIKVISWCELPSGILRAKNPLLEAAKDLGHELSAYMGGDAYIEPPGLARLERVIEEVES